MNWPRTMKRGWWTLTRPWQRIWRPCTAGGSRILSIYSPHRAGERGGAARNLKESLRKIRDQAGCPGFGFHDCRHHFISYAVMSEATQPIPEPITSGQLAAAGVERRETIKLPLITSPHDQTASYRSVLLLPDLSLRSHAKVRSRSGHPGAFHQRLPLGSRQHSVQC